jgi:serine/threonine protein kinase
MVLGQGGFGTVMQGVLHEHARSIAVAVKVLPPHVECRADGMEAIKREAQLLVKLQSPFIVTFYGLTSGSIIVMEFMSHGSLDKMISTSADTLHSFNLKIQLLLDVIRGLEYLHTMGVIHADMKSPNILLTQDNGYLKAKISDFGLTHILGGNESDDTSSPVLALSLRWAAPELLKTGTPIGLSKAQDMYSFGVVIWEIFAMDKPLKDLSRPEIIKRVLSGNRDEIPQGTPVWIVNLIRQCWELDPTVRGSATVVRRILVTNAVAIGEVASNTPPLASPSESLPQVNMHNTITL